MNVILLLVSRNIKNYLRDKTAVFFSFLSAIIIIGLYALFLGKTNVDGLKNMVGDVTGIRFLIDSWIMAGILVVNTITVTLGMFGKMITDKADGKLNGFLVSPVSRSKITFGYLVSSWVMGIFMTIITLIFAEIYIISSGGKMLPAFAMLKVLGLIILSVLSSSTLVFFLVTLINSVSGYSTLSTILGTVIGFVTGIYLPIGILPDAVQAFVKFVPATHATVMMRQVFMEAPLKEVFANAPTEKLAEFKKIYGVEIFVGKNEITIPLMIGVLIFAGLVFLGLSVLSMNRKIKG